jgi:hypothetical protein
MPAERWTELLCHPAQRDRAVRRIAALARRAPSSVLTVDFRVEADLSRLRIPAPSAPRIATRLWEHTCFETFVAMDEDPPYYEFNFAPSGEWAAFAFRSYRDGKPFTDGELAPSITLRTREDRLELGATLRLGRLSPAHLRASLRIGLSAVIEGDDGTLSYWALRHPAAKPDFHHAEAFALRLEPPPEEC